MRAAALLLTAALSLSGCWATTPMPFGDALISSLGQSGIFDKPIDWLWNGLVESVSDKRPAAR